MSSATGSLTRADVYGSAARMQGGRLAATARPTSAEASAPSASEIFTLTRSSPSWSASSGRSRSRTPPCGVLAGSQTGCQTAKSSSGRPTGSQRLLARAAAAAAGRRRGPRSSRSRPGRRRAPGTCRCGRASCSSSGRGRGRGSSPRIVGLALPTSNSACGPALGAERVAQPQVDPVGAAQRQVVKVERRARAELVGRARGAGSD